MSSDYELLCPAGDMERLKTAVRYGADAVYLGATQFGMRSAPKNFTLEQLPEAVRWAHARGVRVYLTVNTILRCDEARQLPDFLRAAGASGVDALIVADLGVIAEARRILPGMALHASTQLGVVNHLTARALYDMGVERAVLARELSLEEMKTIRELTPPRLSLEVFVHGAMCMSVSGRCVISDYLAGRDANRGQCAQPCRWRYHLMEQKRPGLYLPVFEDEQGTTILNAQDLNMIEHLGALARAGAAGFKIEGRAKSSYYVGVVTNAYRAALDALGRGEAAPRWAVAELDTVSHREYSTGFYFGRASQQQAMSETHYIQEYEVSAVVLRSENGRLALSQRNRFSVGDRLELLPPGRPPCAVEVTAIFDEQDTPLDTACHPQMRVSVPFAGDAPEGSFLRRKMGSFGAQGSTSACL